MNLPKRSLFLSVILLNTLNALEIANNDIAHLTITVVQPKDGALVSSPDDKFIRNKIENLEYIVANAPNTVS